MRFTQLSARIATVTRALALSALLLLSLPVGARAADPLLSGYGGPGGGEQVVLGATLVGPPSGGGTAGGPPEGLRAAQSVGGPELTRPAGSPASTGRRHRKSAPNAAGATPAEDPSARVPGAPAVRPYPTRAGDAGGLPLPVGDALIGALALVLLALAAIGLRRLAPPPSDAGAMPQESPR
jgi:hypothetical protein